MSANAMMTTLRWHAMLGGMRCREITVWLDSAPKQRAFQEVAEEVFGLGEVGLLRSVDLGLPVDESTTAPTADGATFLDPRMSTTDRSSSA
jgi:hypothetical protein